METTFLSAKNRLLEFGKEYHACESQYRRLYASDSVESVMDVVKDNFEWCCGFRDFADILQDFQELFAKNKIWINTSIEVEEGTGWLLATNGEHNAVSLGTSTINVRSWGASTINVTSWDNSTINAKSWGASTINAESNDTSTIKATSLGTSTINAESNDTSTIKATSWGYSTIYAESWNTSTINAVSRDTSIMTIFSSAIKCKVKEGSIARYIYENRIVYADATIKLELFEK